MSNRSLAAARSRRSPQEVVTTPGMKKEQPPPSRMASKQGPGSGPGPGKSYGNEDSTFGSSLPNKLSVSDAIGLITIRLSKVESHLLKEQHEGQKQATTNASSVTDVDTVLRSLVSRVNVLEKAQDGVDQDLEELHNTVKDLEGSPAPVNEVVPSTDPLLLERLEKTEKDLSEVKQLVIKLQTMLIDVTMAQKFAPTPVTPPPMVRSVSVASTPFLASSPIPPLLVDDEEGEEYEEEEVAASGSMRVDI